MSKELTKRYIEAFSNKNIDEIALLVDDAVALEDPVVNRVEGKAAFLAAVKTIFDSTGILSFTARNIFEEGNTTLIEFQLRLDDTALKGVDVIEWKGGKMLELRAYLDIPKI